jgi:hypothetical protein
MCMACELSFWDMVEALEPAEREKVLRAQAARFGCDVPEDAAPIPAAQIIEDERKP